jgi:DNA-binding transcriptional regulator PaaX
VAEAEPAQRTWTFLSNHGHVLVHVSRHPGARIRDVAAAVGITERAAQTILRDLSVAGYLSATRTGRRNSYEVHHDAPFRHPLEASHSVGELLQIFADEPGPDPRR